MILKVMTDYGLNFRVEPYLTRKGTHTFAFAIASSWIYNNNEGLHQLAFERELFTKRKCLDMWRYECMYRNTEGLYWEWFWPPSGQYWWRGPLAVKDECVNSQGRILLDLCISARMRIANVRTTGDPAAEITHPEATGRAPIRKLIRSAAMIR